MLRVRDVNSARRIVLILGDQLGEDNPALAQANPGTDAVVMIETRGEAAHVPSHKQRIALFLAAMRHRARSLQEQGWKVDYVDLDAGCPSLAEGLGAAISRHGATAVMTAEPGEWRVEQAVRSACAGAGIPLTVLDDPHFYLSRSDFAGWADGRKTLVMEHFYRYMRQRFDVLMENGQPVGGRWNFDRENRGAFGRQGPGSMTQPSRFAPDHVTRGAMASVERHFSSHPGSLQSFGWPVAPVHARLALADFIEHRLARFGERQDAMWSGEPFLYHSLLSAALNLKLLDPRDCVQAAADALHDGIAPLAAVEGFVRQILGWREFVRGVYWLLMPGYAERNGLGANQPLPGFFWDADTDMNCLHQTIGQTLEHGYAHHIQRLMVTGNFAMLAGFDPVEVCDWYLGVYVDAVEWVELPNTLGMALHADGGVIGTKPYAASANYIRRMSNYCEGCRYRADRRVGDDACPFNFLYWDFLDRHQERFAANPRMRLALGNLQRIPETERQALRASASRFRSKLGLNSSASG